MKRGFPTIFILLLLVSTAYAQVGINTITPQAALDINSTNQGVLLPRVELTSLVTAAPVVVDPTAAIATPLPAGTMVWNTGDTVGSPGFYFWTGTQWNQLVNDAVPLVTANEKQVHFGKMLIDASGNKVITGVGFRPSSIEFTAINRVQNVNAGFKTAENLDGTLATNTNDIRVSGGLTVGYAQNNSGAIDQQAIATGISGSSINGIGTYASESHCFAALFTNNNGEAIHDNGHNSGVEDNSGLISASLTTFDSDGFTINVDNFLAGSSTSNRTNQIVVIYKAYKY
ncbi:hypothetical protein [Nonlabens ponticola]|uniref:Uncharacterized protein n=1 Tax=Nonlabens ponticola TaxID=2496866 RepID=A0A3S9MUS6_9FLAO|nr:hypothetical protein [Nonlabens ponticola]AZQ42927.1 hypothetical protein EJ995_01260 [Nonlabens ponticola]